MACRLLTKHSECYWARPQMALPTPHGLSVGLDRWAKIIITGGIAVDNSTGFLTSLWECATGSCRSCIGTAVIYNQYIYLTYPEKSWGRRVNPIDKTDGKSVLTSTGRFPPRFQLAQPASPKS